MKTTRAIVVLLACGASGFAQQSVALTVPAGVPMRLYVNKRIPKRVGAPVEATLITPVFAFDREVIAAGARVSGRVSRLRPVPSFERFHAVVGGDFTPLHVAEIEFTSVTLQDGTERALSTVESSGLNTIMPLHPMKRKAPPTSTGALGTAKQDARDQIDHQVGRIRDIAETVRGPDKTEFLTDLLMSKLPWHPQYVRKRTRFDAELREPLSFGSETVTSEALTLLGSQPAAGSIGHARLLTALNSKTSAKGETVEAVLAEPLFSGDGKLVLPEGARIEGSVVSAKAARWFHRGGHLRFSFQEVKLPGDPAVAAGFHTQASVTGAEGGFAPLKVDGEGGVQATESKTRFIGAAVAVLIARAAGDHDDHDRLTTAKPDGGNGTVGGRTLGGGLGFGLLGSIAAQSSRNVGAALGYYGMAWTIYRTIVARGAEVDFGRNAVVDIGFNTRPAPETR